MNKNKEVVRDTLGVSVKESMSRVELLNKPIDQGAGYEEIAIMIMLLTPEVEG